MGEPAEIIHLLDGLVEEVLAGTRIYAYPISGHDEHDHIIVQVPAVEAYNYASLCVKPAFVCRPLRRQDRMRATYHGN